MNTDESNTADPNIADVNTDESNTADPNIADVNTAEPAAVDGTSLSPARAKEPLALPAAGFTGPLAALLLLAAGGVGIRDGIVGAGWIDGSLWTRTALQWIDGLTFAGWMIPIAIVSIVVGLALLLAALKPRRRTAVEVAAQTSVYIEPSGVARIAADAARSVAGVLDARASATRRTVTVRADITGDDRSGLEKAIVDRVGSALEPLTVRPKTKVKTRTGGRS